MPLTDFAIRAAKSRQRVHKLSDGFGLQLWLMPTGARLWRLAYRFDGKQKVLALGSYPAVPLKAARELRDAGRRLLTEGIDPASRRRTDKLKAKQSRETTFAVISAELLAKKRREGKATATLNKVRWLIDLALPVIGDRPVDELNPVEVLALLRRIEGSGKLEAARRLRSFIGEVCRYAVVTARATSDPTTVLSGALQAPIVTHRPAITEAPAFGQLLLAIEGYEGQPEARAALRLLPTLFPRPSELREARWSEFDLEAAIWTIPASRAKMRREHRVPLPSQAVSILRDLMDSRNQGVLVFPGHRSADRPINPGTLNAALRRLGYAGKVMVGHGFRAAASTLLNESGKWSVDAIERALAHQDADAVRRAYARGAHWQERVAMAQWWADYLDELRSLAVRRGLPTTT